MSKIKNEQEKSLRHNPKKLTAEGYKRRYLKSLTCYRKQQSKTSDNALPELKVIIPEKRSFLEKKIPSQLKSARALA
jgi:hypothetical protein